MLKGSIAKLVEGQSLSESEAYDAVKAIMEGAATPVQIAAFLTALRMKGETVEEITGAARLMREKALRIYPKAHDVVDTCGTGGDRSGTFNISTTTALVVAGAGVPVAKHGNRSVSSACGSADVLEALGVKIDLKPERVEECLNEAGIAFLFAPVFHLSMKHAAPVRKELGIRTLFNLLGPISNPAGAPYQVMGVFAHEWTEPMAMVLGNLGTRRAFVVHGSDGLDEVTITGPTRVSEWKEGAVSTSEVTPESVGIERGRMADLKGGDAQANARILREVLSGGKGPRRDIVLMNAGLALVAAGRADFLADGVRLAAKAIDSNKALEKLDALIQFTNAGRG